MRENKLSYQETMRKYFSHLANSKNFAFLLNWELKYDKVEIYFNYTNKKSPDDESHRGLLFYQKDKKLLKLERLKTLVFI